MDPEIELESGTFAALRRIDVLRLRRNLGHQRAIAVGLAYVEECLHADAVVVMDGDGEDDPADVPRLLERLDEEGHATIVFAERARRSESLVLRVFYSLFKLLHLLLTGKGVRVGNFSAIPRRRLTSLVVVAEIWNHYAAAVFRSRQPYCMIPTFRARRLCGTSSMNFVSLVTHGLSAISVYSDVVGVRLLVMSIILAILTLAGMSGRGPRATVDQSGHPGLGELFRGDSSRPVYAGRDGRFCLQLRDPEFAARDDVSASTRLFLLHRLDLDVTR